MSLSEFHRERLCFCCLDQPIESIGILRMFCLCVQSGLCFAPVVLVNRGSWFCSLFCGVLGFLVSPLPHDSSPCELQAVPPACSCARHSLCRWHCCVCARCSHIPVTYLAMASPSAGFAWLLHSQVFNKCIS